MRIPVGTGSGSVSIETTEKITVNIDYVTGTSPASGTIITSQADADSLGTLKYLQDIIDILPTHPNYPVTANVASGEQYCKPGTADVDGFVKSFMIMHPFSSTNIARDDYLSSTFGPGIAFSGQRDAIETGISGTIDSSTKTFVRSSGVWTENELVGKFFYVESGANSASKFVISKNTTDTIYFSNTALSSGAASIETYQNGTILVPSSDGVALDAGGVVDLVFGPAASKFHYYFDTIQFGKTSFGMPITQRSCTMTLRNCSVYGYFQILPVYSSKVTISIESSFVQFEDDLYSTSSPLFKIRGKESRGSLDGNVFVGSPDHGTIWDIEDQGSVFGYGDQVIRPTGTFSGSCALFDGSAHVEVNNLIIEGNNLCTGIEFRGRESGGASARIGFENAPQIDNCSRAIWVRRVNGLAFPEIIGTGNAIGWELTESSSVTCESPDSVSATTDFILDSQSYEYSLLSESGNQAFGIKGSSILAR